MLIAYIVKDGKKITVATKTGCNKEKFKDELKESNISFDGVDKIYNIDL